MKPRFIVFVIIIFVGVIGLGIAASGNRGSSGGVSQQRPAATLKFTIASDSVGDDYITITNEATGARITITQNMMPYTGKFAKSDVITFKVTPKEGYIFNAWVIDDGTWESSNPLSLRPTGDFTMKAYFLGLTETS